MDSQEPAALAIVAAAAVMLLRLWRRRKTCSSCPAKRGSPFTKAGKRQSPDQAGQAGDRWIALG